MTMVKRYTLVNGLLHHVRTLGEHELFSGAKEIVFASDYDALAAELAIEKEFRALERGVLTEISVELIAAQQDRENECRLRRGAERVYKEISAELLQARARITELSQQRPASLRQRAAELEAALREIADFAEQFIGDDEDGDERMYKVHQIADNAIPFTAETACKHEYTDGWDSHCKHCGHMGFAPPEKMKGFQ
jgi:hypothetical protein